MDRSLTQRNEGKVNGWTIWKIIGSLDNKTSGEAYEMGLSMIEENEKTVIDMSELEYLSSAGIRVLLKLTKQAGKLDRKIIAAGAKGVVRDVLEDSMMSVILELKYSMDFIDNTAE